MIAKGQGTIACPVNNNLSNSFCFFFWYCELNENTPNWSKGLNFSTRSMGQGYTPVFTGFTVQVCRRKEKGRKRSLRNNNSELLEGRIFLLF